MDTKITRITADKNDDSANHNTPVVFDLGVNMDEASRNEDTVVLNFQMMMDTEPSIVKFAIDGTATATGEPSEIEKMMSADPQTNVPPIFTRIYEQVYSIVFMLAGTLDVPYPSPALLKRTQVRTAIQDQIQR